MNRRKFLFLYFTRRQSSSRVFTPSSTVLRKAGIVFSGIKPRVPRCPSMPKFLIVCANVLTEKTRTIKSQRSFQFFATTNHLDNFAIEDVLLTRQRWLPLYYDTEFWLLIHSIFPTAFCCPKNRSVETHCNSLASPPVSETRRDLSSQRLDKTLPNRFVATARLYHSNGANAVWSEWPDSIFL